VPGLVAFYDIRPGDSRSILSPGTHTGYYNVRKYSFSSRVVNAWNCLPNDVTEADPINTLKNHLDKYWSNQDVLFSFNADLIESLPFCM